ncbi:MAG TPA: RNA-binding protein [Acidobacteriota bacterium]|nr:RNA-binding protein [Acidobacteriota bacterium]
MSVRLFVGNLPYDTTEAELREYLSPAGTLSSVYLPVNRETGKPRGFAFVEFTESGQAEEAIRRYNNQPFKGRNLSISEARARESRPPEDGRRFGPPREMRAPAGPASFDRSPRVDRMPPLEMEQTRSGRAGRAPERRKAGGRRSDFSARFERGGPKKPIREKPGGRIYDDFDDFDDFQDDALLEDDFSRRLETAVEEEDE